MIFSELNPLFIFIVATALCSCAPIGPPTTSYHVNYSELNTNAIIITKLTYLRPRRIFSGATKGYVRKYQFSKIDQKYFENKFGTNYAIKHRSKEKYDIFMVKPGFYVLDGVTVSIGDTVYKLKESGYDYIKNRTRLGGFVAKPGQILYIGDIELTIKNGNFYKVVNDSYDDAVKYFRMEYPEINKKVDKYLLSNLKLKRQ